MLSLKFSKHTIMEMLNILATSEKIKKEVGFSLCKKDAQIVHNEELTCVGTKCGIVPSKECGNLEHVGFFHTHTHEAFPSFSDIAYAYKTGILCIGQNDEQNTGTIFCHERKSKEYDPKIHNEIVQKGRETKKDIDEHVTKRITDKKVILNKYFNTVIFQKRNYSNIVTSDYEYKIQ